MNFRKNRGDESDLLIDIAPLIDVVFILLIFFMVTTTFSRESALEIQLPEASSDPKQSPQLDALVISIDAQGKYAVNGKVLFEHDQTAMHLKTRLQAELDNAPHTKPPVIINADGQAPHQAVISAMDAARQLGITRVNFATQSAAGN